MSLDGTLGIDLTARDLTGPAFASLAANLKKVQDQNDKLADSLNKQVGVVGAFGSVISAIGFEKVASEALDWNNAVIKQVASYTDLSERLGVNTQQYQALRLAAGGVGVSQDELQNSVAKFNATIGAAQEGNKEAIDSFAGLGINILDVNGKVRPMSDLLTEAARAILQIDSSSGRARAGVELFGKSGSTLTPLLKQFASGTDTLTSKFQAMGMMVGSDTVEKLHQLQTQSDASKERLAALWASFAGPVEAKVITGINNNLADLIQRMQDAKGSWYDMLKAFAGPIEIKPMGVDPTTLAQARLNAQLADKQKQLDLMQGHNAGPDTAGNAVAAQYKESLTVEKAALQQQMALLDQKQAITQKEAEIKGERDRLLNDGLPAQDSFKTAGASNPPPKDGGGAGGAQSDKVGEAIARLQGEKAAADKALASLVANASMPLDLLNQQVDLQKKTDDEIAKLGAKAQGDPRLDQLKAEIVASQQAQAALKREQEAISLADATQRKYGDGLTELADTHRKLGDALATGRLSTEAYSIAMKDADTAARQQALTMQGQLGGLNGLVAGFQSAALAAQKQNETFTLGGQAFQSTASLMSNAFTDWRKKGQIDMQSFLSSWVDMLAQMALKAAANQAFAALFQMGGNALSSLLNGGSSTYTPGTMGTSVGADGGMPTWGVAGYADGGSPPIGVPSMVGENGPELFVPNQAGTIIPNGNLAGGGQIVINHTVQISTGVSQTVRAELLTLMPQMTASMLDAVQAARQRGGKFAAAFRS